MTIQSQNYEKELSELYKYTYGEARQYMSSFEKVSVLKAGDGQKYAVGALRNNNEQYTSNGDFEPHMRSSNVIFAAAIDNQGHLSGDSIRIKGDSEESCYYSQSYKSKMKHLSGYQNLEVREACTFIVVDFNKGEELPRTVLCSDNSVQGKTQGDYSTIIDGFYNVADREALLEASQSSRHHNLYLDTEKNQKIADVCSQFLIPDETDKICREAEKLRLKKNAEKQALQEKIEKRKALRKFIEREKEKKSKGLKIFGCDVLHNPARKVLAKRMLPKLLNMIKKDSQKEISKPSLSYLEQPIVHQRSDILLEG